MKYFIAGGILVAAASPFIWNYVFSGIQKSRIYALFKPEEYPDIIYQQQQGLNAIKNGGVFGQGLFNGRYTQIVPENENDMIEVFTKHRIDDVETELELSDESSGTKKLFGLLPFIVASLLAGTTLVIDELDAKIHPALLRRIIMMFNNMEINRNKAQLIFTSHDLSTNFSIFPLSKYLTLLSQFLFV